MTPRDMERKMALISGTTDYSGFGLVDLVIEAVVEDLAVKRQVLQEVEAATGKETLLASNTSTLSITELAKGSQRADRVAGFHFFNPVHRMPLVEVVRGARTSDKTVATLVAFAKQLGKIPIVVKDAPGFLVNRILAPYLNEAALLLEEGARIEDIDEVMLNFGMPMGPLHLIDEIGLDVAVKAAQGLAAAFGARVAVSPVLERVFADGRLGKKAGKGFYRYEGKKKVPDPAIYTLIAEVRREARAINRGELQARLVLLMVNEAARCLDEGVVSKPGHVDAGMVFGTGFPSFRGGLLRYADKVGVKHIYAQLEAFAEKLGPRFASCEYLRKLATTGRGFYDRPV